jgi:hypothetical protein
MITGNFTVDVDDNGSAVLVVVTEFEHYPEQPGTKYQEEIPEYIEVESGYALDAVGEVDFWEVYDRNSEYIDKEILEKWKSNLAEYELESVVTNQEICDGRR